MTERIIQIANTKTQRRYSINTSATTLGELQDEMTAMGIDFTGMTFTEGISKTELLSRESLLPTNVMYKGQPTNNLVMLLTNTTKQISSGCIERSRKEAYEIINSNGKNFKDAIKERFGKNYTMVSNDHLWAFIDECVEYTENHRIENTASEEPAKPAVKTAPKTSTHPDLVELLYLGVKYLTKVNALYADDVAVISDLTGELSARMKTVEVEISDSDIDDIIASI